MQQECSTQDCTRMDMAALAFIFNGLRNKIQVALISGIVVTAA